MECSAATSPSSTDPRSPAYSSRSACWLSLCQEYVTILGQDMAAASVAPETSAGGTFFCCCAILHLDLYVFVTLSWASCAAVHRRDHGSSPESMQSCRNDSYTDGDCEKKPHTD